MWLYIFMLLVGYVWHSQPTFANRKSSTAYTQIQNMGPILSIPNGPFLLQAMEHSPNLIEFNQLTGFISKVENRNLPSSEFLNILMGCVHTLKIYWQENNTYSPERFESFKAYLGIALNKWLGPKDFRALSEWAAQFLPQRGSKIPNYLVVIPPLSSKKAEFTKNYY